VSFGTVAIGTTSLVEAVTLTNVGGTTLTINGIAITGVNAGDFAQTHACGSSLAAGASCSISVTFKPKASGTRTAALSVTDNAPGSPQTVTLTGRGTTAKLSPTSLSLGTVAIGTTSLVEAVTLTNVGGTTLTINGIAITGVNAGDFAQTHACGSSLTAGASCSISVTFKPTASGTRTAALTVTDNASGSPQTVSLSGTGTTASGTLTGYCWGSVSRGAPQQCGIVQDLAQCPVGHSAITPTRVVGCFPPQSQLIDNSRPCKARNPRGQVISGACTVSINGSAQ
jgi:hypothetical protein